MRSLDKTDDKELIALCRSGSDNGYAGLYNKYAKRLYNTIHRIVLHTSEAEDILQETFVAVFSDISKLETVDNLDAWMKRVAINRSISQLRKRRAVFLDIEEADIDSAEQYHTHDGEQLECRIADLQQAIGQLPELYRTIVNLHVFEDMPQEEIGRALGMSHTAVRSQYHRAKKKIAQLLKKKSYHE